MDARYLGKLKFRDKSAKWLITLGGISIIAGMLVMILFMFGVTLPLFKDPEQRLMSTFRLELPESTPVVFGTGPYLEVGFALRANGEVWFFDLKDGKALEKRSLRPSTGEEVSLTRALKCGSEDYNLFWSDGSVSLVRFLFKPSFDQQGKRTIEPHTEIHAIAPPVALGNSDAPAAGSPAVFRADGEGSATLVRVLPPRRLALYRKQETEDFLGEVTATEEDHLLEVAVEGSLAAIALDAAGERLFAGTDRGELVAWDLGALTRPRLIDRAVIPGKAIANLTFAFGEVTLIAGDDSGGLTAWNLVPGDPVRLQMIRELPGHDAEIVQIFASSKDKSLLSLDSGGIARIAHLTSGNDLLRFSTTYPLQRVFLAERNDGMLGIDSRGDFWLWGIHMPHPEINGKALWGKLWYEGYQKPAYVWQSSSASDDFEPKLSLMPLLFGSLKGTFYGMLFSFPLALLSAMYVSHLMNPRWRAIIKPVVELMAAVPSVVIGFLAALWLAPRLEGNLLAVVFSLVFVPLAVAAGMILLFKRKRTTGFEFIWGLPLVIAGVFIAYHVGVGIQNLWFDGNLNLWLFRHLEMTVDQRNCVVIGFALGFAVIPVIFTIAEDALYNVPRHLTAAALALGSSRWQTLRHVVLPMASPGIFAGTMIGFGRAVGETMIVLMATGNTPIMSVNILNGMRTLAANIAVEIPEAPVGSTLYRVLFLSAVLLFSMTFVVNTLAEVVRVRLRKKYKSL